MTVLQSYLAGQWFGRQAAKPLASAINGEIVAHTHDDAPDFTAAVDYARTTGTRELLKLDFQERAAVPIALVPIWCSDQSAPGRRPWAAALPTRGPAPLTRRIRPAPSATTTVRS